MALDCVSRTPFTPTLTSNSTRSYVCTNCETCYMDELASDQR